MYVTTYETAFEVILSAKQITRKENLKNVVYKEILWTQYTEKKMLLNQ